MCRKHKISSFVFLSLIILFAVILSGSIWETQTSTIIMKSENQRCQCKSLFTIGGCNLNEFSIRSEGPKWWKMSLRNLQEARLDQNISMFEVHHNLAKLIPFTLNGEPVEHKNSVYSHSNNNLTQIEDLHRNDWRTTSIPHIPCQIHIYTQSDIKSCLAKRRQVTGKVLKIAFVGDSQIRLLLEVIIAHLRETLNLTNGENNGKNLTTDFLDRSSKSDWPVIGDNIYMKFHWSTFISKKRGKAVTAQGAYDVLQTWANGEKVDGVEEIPDILYFDSGTWRDQGNLESVSVDKLRYSLMKVRALFSKMEHTQVIFRMGTPFKQWEAKHLIEDERIEWNNKAAWQVFGDSNVWIWDTITPYYLKGINECRKHHRGFTPKLWACNDFVHPSKIHEKIAENMLWNYVCNDFMNLDTNHCCG